ncbi:hypothetical protein L1887_17345 [Cichorium endivia]|nr:hypothetical protein L1887_17345 [Cichorium endivia]
MDVFFSDFDSYSESSSSSEDREDDEFMYGSILSNLEDTIGNIDDFLSFERQYVHEDIVYSIHDPSGQTGKVIHIEMTVDLENVYGKKLKDIDFKKLKRIRSISVGDYVVYGSWVGKADKIVDRVTVLFDDGTKCEFIDNDNLVPLSSDSFDGSSFYFPGQRVKLESAHWFCGTQRYEDKGTVSAVDVGFVYVNWVGCARFHSEGRTPPESFQRSHDLISLSGFAHSNWQLGDRCLLPGFQEILVISKIKSKLDVLWQDGIESRGLDSGSVSPVNIVDPHDFYPHQFVLEKSSDDQENHQEIRKWGVVMIVNANEKTVKVKWEEIGIEETVSAYELIEHPEFSFCHGDVVFGLENTWPIGIVKGLKDGRVEVKWATGYTSKVGPREISRMDKSEGMPAASLVHHGNIEPNQEKSEHGNHAINPKEKVLDGDKKSCLRSLFDSTTFNVPQATVSFLSDFVARFFGSPSYTSLSSTSNSFSLSGGQRSSSDSPEESVLFIETKENECKDVPFSSSSKNLGEFEKFAVVNDCSNHHFVDRVGNGLISNQVKRSWIKKVQQEWNILMNHLPEMIYVRVFEERMDLLQATIIGAPGTPYHDGLFLFDIFLPQEYPHEPPMVHYVSGGLRVNPNLYESGRVCLSLLNTWSGTGTETWNPQESTILQVLLSPSSFGSQQESIF